MLTITAAPGSQKRYPPFRTRCRNPRAFGGGRGLRDSRATFGFRGLRETAIINVELSPRHFPYLYRPFFRSILRAILPSRLSHYRFSSRFPPPVTHRYLSPSLSLSLSRGQIRREIITARLTACNQRSLMAPHYAKRRAKGAWHFLSRRMKNQERPAASCERRRSFYSL